MTEGSKQLRVLVAHPERQHSFRLATALKKAGVLDKYVTTVYYGRERWSLTRIAALFLRGDLRASAHRRVCLDLADDDVLVYFEALGLLTILAYRVDSSSRFTRLCMRVTSWLFQGKVARYAVRHRVDAVIMYDSNAQHCFELLAKKAPGIKRIIDHAHPVRNFVYEVYRNQAAAGGAFVKTYHEPFLLDQRVAARYGLEAQTAQYHIVASSFSRESVRFNGISDENIILAPYGVDAEGFFKREHKGSSLRVLYVGQVTQRKGIAQILEAARRLRDKDFSFEVVGAGREGGDRALYVPYEEFVTFRGLLDLDEVREAYGAADIFVFPSMGDGFGLVMLEAMSAGLPVICSTNCAGADIVRDGENGFVIPAGDTDALIDRLLWLQANRQSLARMGLEARATALTYSWRSYELAIADGLRRVFQS
jgi:glycosyltransferase involved in cell wall biosynthesis